ncbi:MAG: hypothetical protein ABJA57_04270 [Ginsengibacter sp.]
MKIIFLICCMIISLGNLQSHAQIHDSTSKKYYTDDKAKSLFLKSKRQKSTAWILMAGGVGLATAGVISGTNSNSFSDNSLENAGALVLVGIAGCVASIPFFISSGKNKRKANIILKPETFRYDAGPKINTLAIGMQVNL